MGAPRDTKYRISKSSCSGLLAELHSQGLLLSSHFDLPDDGFMIYLQKKQPKGFAPPMIFSECPAGETMREIETMWTDQNRQVAQQIEQAILQHGGTIISGSVRDTK